MKRVVLVALGIIAEGRKEVNRFLDFFWGIPAGLGGVSQRSV